MLSNRARGASFPRTVLRRETSQPGGRPLPIPPSGLPAAFSLTRRQHQLLLFIIGYQEAHGGVSPTFNEMVAGIQAKSRGHVFPLITALEERGWIRRLPNRARAIEVINRAAIPRTPDGRPVFFVSMEIP